MPVRHSALSEEQDDSSWERKRMTFGQFGHLDKRRNVSNGISTDSQDCAEKHSTFDLLIEDCTSNHNCVNVLFFFYRCDRLI